MLLQGGVTTKLTNGGTSTASPSRPWGPRSSRDPERCGSGPAPPRHSKARLALTGGGPLVDLTGAGVSAESGVPTFRDARTGLWERYDPAALATPRRRGSRTGTTVWAWYRWRERLVCNAEPNAGHRAIARAAEARRVVVVTQNVDDLHERSGSPDVHHLHGSLFEHRCDACATPMEVGPPPSNPWPGSPRRRAPGATDGPGPGSSGSARRSPRGPLGRRGVRDLAASAGPRRRDLRPRPPRRLAPGPRRGLRHTCGRGQPRSLRSRSGGVRPRQVHGRPGPPGAPAA